MTTTTSELEVLRAEIHEVNRALLFMLSRRAELATAGKVER